MSIDVGYCALCIAHCLLYAYIVRCVSALGIACYGCISSLYYVWCVMDYVLLLCIDVVYMGCVLSVVH